MQQVRLGAAKPLISFFSARYCPRDSVHTLKELLISPVQVPYRGIIWGMLTSI